MENNEIFPVIVATQHFHDALHWNSLMRAIQPRKVWDTVTENFGVKEVDEKVAVNIHALLFFVFDRPLRERFYRLDFNQVLS